MLHEPLATCLLNFVLDERSRRIALDDNSSATSRSDLFAPLEAKCLACVGIVQRFRSVVPMDLKWPDAMNLNDGFLGSITEHPAPLRSEGIASGLEFSQRGRLIAF